MQIEQILYQRILKNVRQAPDDCVLWKGSLRNRYGQIKYQGRNYSVHRVTYVATKGPIPLGLLVCHTCDVRHCVNEDHLWLGTVKQNAEDMVSKGRGVHTFVPGSNHPSAKLTEADVLTIRADGTRSQCQMARDYGVSPRTIWGIMHCHCWQHI